MVIMDDFLFLYFGFLICFNVGLTIFRQSNLILLRSCFSSLFKGEFSGDKAISFYNRLGSPVIILCNGNNSRDVIRNYEQVFRRFFADFKAFHKHRSLLVLVQSTAEDVNEEEFRNEMHANLTNIWGEYRDENDQDSLSFQILVIPKDVTSNINTIRSVVSEFIYTNSVAKSVENFVNSLQSAWASLPSSTASIFRKVSVISSFSMIV
jgi:hypothetical protein